MEETDELTGLFTEALFDTAALEPALAKLAEFCSAPVAQLMMTDNDRTLLRSSFSGPVDYETLDTEGLFQDINPRVKALSGMKVGACTRDKDFIAYDEIRMDTTYQELVIPSGLGHFAGVPISLDPNSVIGLAIHRPIMNDAFDDRDARKFETLAKGLMPVFSFAKKIEKRDSQTALGVVGPDVAAAILGHNCHVLDMNTLFEELLEYENILQIRGTTLLARDVQTDAYLREKVSCTDVHSSKILLRAAHDQNHRVATLTKLPNLGFSCGGVLITVEPRELGASGLSVVQAGFQLTDAETDVAAMLISGLSLGEISIQRRVKLSTVKSQLKGLFQKTHTKRQGELIALLLGLK